METINPIDTNQVRIIGNNSINVSNSNINRISGPSQISNIDRPILQQIDTPIIRGLEVPVVNVPNTTVQYPVVRIPVQADFNTPVKNEQKPQEQTQEKPRGLPDTKPQISPQVSQNFQSPTTPASPQIQTTRPITEVPADKSITTPTFSVYGVNINLPDPSLVATAGAVAVVTTAATMASSAVLNVLKNAAEPFIKEATKNKFKIKIKQVKPVLHYVMAEEGHIDIFEYSAEGTRLVTQTSNVEQYIRDEVEKNVLYEIENKIIIDDVIKDRFTKEGQERFKSLYAPAKKIAKKLAARLSF
jgi:hypothetical protein